MTRNKLICLLLLLMCSGCSDASMQTNATYPDQQSADFKLFAKQCSACHRPPMPNKHPASLWPSTLNRMQQHRQKRGLTMMTKGQQQQVLAYLQRHAKQDMQP